MIPQRPRRWGLGRPLLALILAAGLMPAVAVASVVSAPAAHADQTVVVDPHPENIQPRIMNGRVYAIDTHGPLVAVGGSFTTIRAGGGGADIPRQWIFLFNSDTGQIVSSFDPVLAGPTPVTTGVTGDQPGVEGLEFAPDGQSLYIGGWFTSVNGTAVDRLARIDLNGDLLSSFKASANAVVKDLALVGDRLVVAGRFGRLNNQPVSRLGSVSPSTGATQTDFNLPATESRDQYAPYVQEIDASPDGNWLAVAGSFLKIGTKARNQLALINLQGTPRVAGWSTEAYAGDCASVYEDSWIRGLDISPDNRFLVVSTTGGWGGASSFCDTAARFELPPVSTGDDQQATWVNHTGGDTFWANHITSAAVYVGGHQRWVNNPNPSPGGDNDGPGAVARAGIVALDPLNGVPLSWNPSRDRGRGVEVITSDDSHLFVGHDTDYFDGELRQRLAVLSTHTGTVNPAPETVDLPVTMTIAYGSDLYSANFTGASFGSFTNTSGSLNWNAVRGGFFQHGAFHYFGANSAFYKNALTGASSWSTPTNLSATVGYVDSNYNLTAYDQPYNVAETTAATFKGGWMYYVRSGDSRLWKRGYSLESGIIGSEEYVASSQSFSGARALDFIGDWLYAAWSDGRLYRFYAPGGNVDYASMALVDSGSTVNWGQVHAMFSRPGTGTAVPPTPPTTPSCSGSNPWTAQYWSNRTLSGGAATTRCEAAIDYTWGSGAPSGVNVPADNFSVRWTRTVTLTEPGALQISATVDDGVRAYVDGERVINSWVDSSAATRTGTSGRLEAGEHTVRIEMYENAGSASARVSLATVAPPAQEPDPDNLPPDAAVVSPSENQVVSTGSFTITGTATDARDVAQVRVGIFDRSSSRWLQPDGSWGSTYAARTATLAAPGTPSTTWSLPITLPEGTYAVDARATDAAGNEDPTPAWRPFRIDFTPTDTAAPGVTITTPTQDQSFASTSVTLAGDATDDTGVTQVRVAVQNRTSSQYLQADGSWGPASAFRTATLASSGATSTGWTLPVTVPTGAYVIDVRARDAAGNLTTPSVRRRFSAGSDTVKPDTAIAAPARNAVVGTTFTASGTATDDVGVAKVKVAVYNRSDSVNKWLQPNGTWGPNYAMRLATLASPGSTSTTWNLSINLPAGLYGLDVKAADAAGNNDATPAWQPFQVGNDTVAPSATISSARSDSTARSATVRSGKIRVSGIAKDNAAVFGVKLQVRKLGAAGSKTWLQKRNRWGRKPSYLLADVAAPGRRKTAWSMVLRLPPGRYQVRVVGQDATRNVSRKAATQTITVVR